uniref:gamma-parvin n=1 Tax=Ictidomys tridecemlineatus TaxID=43179 RepID=UPI001A9E2432|nr:gamma-parvin [Ictidomys tridecemlineatus]
MPLWRCLGGRAGSQAVVGPGSRGLLQPGPPSALLARSTEEEAPRGHRHQQSRPQRKCAGPLPPPQGPGHPPAQEAEPASPRSRGPWGGPIARVQEAPGQAREKMEPESLYNLLQLHGEAALPTEEQLPPGAKKKYLPPSSRKDPKFEELQKVGQPQHRCSGVRPLPGTCLHLGDSRLPSPFLGL